MDALNTINIPISTFGKWVFPEEIDTLTFSIDIEHYNKLLGRLYYLTVIANQLQPFYHINSHYEVNSLFQYLNYEGKLNSQFNKWKDTTSVSKYLINKTVKYYPNKNISLLGGCVKDGILADYVNIGSELYHNIITPSFREKIARSIILNYLEWVGIGGKEERRFSENDTNTLVQLSLVHPAPGWALC